MLEYIITIVVAIILIAVSWRIGFIKGYRKGASFVLTEWKEVNRAGEDEDVR